MCFTNVDRRATSTTVEMSFNGERMKFGAHLPLMDFGGHPYTLAHLAGYTRRAAELGFDTLTANDHLVFASPWLDGPTALASVIGDSGSMTLATTVSLPVVRGPVQLAKAMTALDLLSGGRTVAAVGPGSSPRDYEIAGVDFGGQGQQHLPERPGDHVVPHHRRPSRCRPDLAPTARTDHQPAGGPAQGAAPRRTRSGLRRKAPRPFRDAGVQQVLVWPVTDEERQLERFCEQVIPLLAA